VNRSELTELHYITPVQNVPSILQHGVLCHQLAERVAHESVAMQEVQDLRARKTVPGGLPLHQYVNLYVHARNAMLYKRRIQHMALCILRIHTDVLDLPQVIIADGNAASRGDYTRFYASPSGLEELEKDEVFAVYWTDPDPIRAFYLRRVRCAEVLVPRRLDARYIIGAHVSCREVEATLRAAGWRLAVNVDPHLFFVG